VLFVEMVKFVSKISGIASNRKKKKKIPHTVRSVAPTKELAIVAI